jgi:hypothetical protein
MEDGDGRLTGRDALKFFAMSKLSRDDLKQVNSGNLAMHTSDNMRSDIRQWVATQTRQSLHIFTTPLTGTFAFRSSSVFSDDASIFFY